MASGPQEQLRQELGPDFDDVKWGQLDPRPYNPRRIIREALADGAAPPPQVMATAGPVGSVVFPRLADRLPDEHAAPFDSEST